MGKYPFMNETNPHEAMIPSIKKGHHPVTSAPPSGLEPETL